MLKQYWKRDCCINIIVKPNLLFLKYNIKLLLFFARDKNKYVQIPVIFFLLLYWDKIEVIFPKDLHPTAEILPRYDSWFPRLSEHAGLFR